MLPFLSGMDSVDKPHSVVDKPWIRHGQQVAHSVSTACPQLHNAGLIHLPTPPATTVSDAFASIIF